MLFYIEQMRGEDETRTRNRLLAKQVHFQLCYIPKNLRGQCGTRTRSASMPYSCAAINTNRPSCQEYVHSILAPTFPERRRPESHWKA